MTIIRRYRPLHQINKQAFTNARSLEVGPYGKVWKQDLAAIEAKLHKRDQGRPHSTVCSYIVRAEWANVAWHSYWIGCCHLRPMYGVKPAIIYLPGATHEIFVWALNPDEDFAIDDSVIPHLLHPTNFGAQFICESDAIAEERVLHSIREIIKWGTLSPDTDYMQLWMSRYGDNMIKGNKSEAGQTKIIIGYGQPGATEIVIPPAKEEDPSKGSN